MTKIKSLERIIKSQKTRYERIIEDLKKQLLEHPKLYNETVANYNLLMHRFNEAEGTIKELLLRRGNTRKIVEQVDRSDMRKLIDHNTSLQHRLELANTAYNRMVYEIKTSEAWNKAKKL